MSVKGYSPPCGCGPSKNTKKTKKSKKTHKTNKTKKSKGKW
jgi:hypothetical protein